MFGLMSLKISIFKEGELERSLELSGRVLVIGRSAEADVVLDSHTVSRWHCELKVKKIGLTIKDLDSRNGTTLNGQSLVAGNRTRINEGDLIKVGKFKLRLDRVEYGSDAESDVDKSPLGLAGSLELNGLMPPTANVLSQDNLLDDLEDLIRSRIKDRRVTSGTNAVASKESDSGRLSVAMTTSLPDLSSAKTVVKDALQSQSNPMEETIDLPLGDDAPDKDTSNAQRSLFRERMEALKAKDSQEAATRALKKLFGG